MDGQKVTYLNRRYICADYEVRPTVAIIIDNADRDSDAGTRHYVQLGWRDGSAVAKITFWYGGIDITFYVRIDLIPSMAIALMEFSKGVGLANGLSFTHDLFHASIGAAHGSHVS